MAGATKLFATTIDIRDVTKWIAERRHSCSEAFDFRCGGAALSYHNRNARLLDELRHRHDYCQQGRAILEHRSRLNRSRFHEPKLRSRPGIGAFVADHFQRDDIGLRRR